MVVCCARVSPLADSLTLKQVAYHRDRTAFHASAPPRRRWRAILCHTSGNPLPTQATRCHPSLRPYTDDMQSKPPVVGDIRLLLLNDIEAYVDHMERHVPQSGRDGALIYNPFDNANRWDGGDDLATRSELEWAQSTSAPGWRRVWGVFDRNARVVGSINLKGYGLASQSHRCLMAMGIEEGFRGEGVGTALLNAAVNWAREQPQLDWVDLGVFSTNAPARALYTAFGFIEVGVTPDLFRVWGQSVDDVTMVLDVSTSDEGAS